MPLVKQLAAQLILPFLHVVEALQRGKGPDALALAHHRNHRQVYVGPAHIDHLGLLDGSGLQTFPEGDIGKYLLPTPPRDQVRAHSGDLPRLLIAGEYLPLLIDADQPLVQNLH